MEHATPASASGKVELSRCSVCTCALAARFGKASVCADPSFRSFWGASRIQRDLGKGFAMVANRLGYDMAPKSATRPVLPTYPPACAFFLLLFKPPKTPQQPTPLT